MSAIDPGFVPAALWNKAYREQCAHSSATTPLTIGLARPDGTASHFRTSVLPVGSAEGRHTLMYVERIIKFLLWARGGSKVYLSGPQAESIASILRVMYAPGGERQFDEEFAQKLFQEKLSFVVCSESELPAESTSHLPLGRNLNGCRIGFDLGGSDRKCAAVVDGEVVFSEEVKWDPYFQSDPRYHLEGILHSLKLAAHHLPRRDAIGGSSAGVYINNEVGVASLFRGITDADVFQNKVRRMFLDIRKAWNDVPFEVLNDGDVTALAGSMSLGKNGVLGVAMGTSVAAGYVDREGRLTNWLSELAFVPVDYRENGPIDEWSGDFGCGVQYFSQQGVARLLPKAGIHMPRGMKFPEQLEGLQHLMKVGDPRAHLVYEAIGIAFGYTLAHFAEFYDYQSLLIMGRVTSGDGGSLIINQAREVLGKEFPQLAIELVVPDEKSKRHGQAVAAASLPSLAQ